MHLKFSSLQGLQATSNEEQRLLQGDHRTPCPMILNLKQKYASNDLAAIIQDPRRIDQTFTIGIPAAHRMKLCYYKDFQGRLCLKRLNCLSMFAANPTFDCAGSQLNAK